ATDGPAAPMEAVEATLIVATAETAEATPAEAEEPLRRESSCQIDSSVESAEATKAARVEIDCQIGSQAGALPPDDVPPADVAVAGQPSPEPRELDGPRQTGEDVAEPGGMSPAGGETREEAIPAARTGSAGGDATAVSGGRASLRGQPAAG